jgi:hypothetical protein
MRFRILWTALACFALMLPVALAQTTGEVYGVVRDKDGATLPGATVTISGPQLPRGQSTTTLSNGVFRFAALPPGNYKLRAELSGMGSFNQDVLISLGKTTEVYPTLRVTATAEVTVTAATPLVDTKSTEIANVTSKDTIEKLPLARTFTGTFQLAPGVAENNSSAPNAGGFRQDNTFLYDGVNITNPFFGDLYQNFAELDIQEVSITRGGVTAEFGRTGGFIVNGVTKSGTNNIHAEVRLEDQPASFAAKSKDPALTSQFQVFRPGVDIGLPIWRDHLFFYGSANLLRQTEQNRVNNLGPVPDSPTHINEYFAKLTGNPTSNVLIDGSFRYRGINQTQADIASTTAPSAGDNPTTIDRVIVGSAFWTVTPKLSLEARFNHNEDNNSVFPDTNIPFKTAFDPQHPYLVGSFITGKSSTNGTSYIYPPANGLGQRIGGSDLASNTQNFFRDEYRLQGSYLTTFFGANHDIRAGFTLSNNEEDLIRAADGWGTITISDSSNCGPVSARPCYRARYTTPGSQFSQSKTYGAFLQDQMTWSHLTVNLGVLVNEDYYIPNTDGTIQAFTFIRGDFHTPGNATSIPACSTNPTTAACSYQARINIPWSKQWQPRIGIAYEVDSSVHDKAYVNLARYDNMDNQSLARAAAPIRLGRTDTYLNLTTGAVIQDIVRANQTGKLVIPNIKPTYTDELITGYARPFGSGWSAELWGMYRHTTDIIEDFTANPVYGNPTTGAGASAPDFRYGNISGFRRYRAVTAEVRKISGSWTMDASYTLSRLDGNWDLEAGGTSLFYSSSYVGDGPGLFPTDPNQQGIELGDRTHIAKLFGTYELPTKTIFGGYLRFQSGRPWEARGFDAVNGVALLPLEPKGSRRLSSWTNFDLLVAQRIPAGPASVRIEGRVLNVFNSQPTLTVNQTFCNSTPCLVESLVPASNINPAFGTPTSYAPPRRFLLSAILSY